jgi:peptidoglycan hydrolase-like protein with peptidoglycan-binding domain
MEEPDMRFGTAFVGMGVGAGVAMLTRKDPWKYALWGGGIGFVVSLVGGASVSLGGASLRVGQLPQSLPTPALPGQMDYSTDPRADPRLDPVSKRNLYPLWLLAHWQNGDRKIIMIVQQALGVPADGSPGSGTAVAIRGFQAQMGLSPSGVMDAATMSALVPG